jgi:hypothetical protein
VPDVLDPEWARDAIERFAELLREQPAMFKASRTGSERGAESLSPRPFQGITETLQNADDVGASWVRLRITRAPNALLLVHNGTPVNLGHAAAMLLPWLTTKDEEAEAAGRFGIGQQTLRAVGGPIEIHCPPWSFQLGEHGPQWVRPARPHGGLYDPRERQTLIRVPLSPDVDPAALAAFIREHDASILLFMRSVRELSFSDDGIPGSELAHRLDASESIDVPVTIRSHELTARRLCLTDPSSGTAFHRYMVDVPLEPAEQRRYKARGSTATLGIALPLGVPRIGRMYDRVPTPIPWASPLSITGPFDPDAARTTVLENAWNRHRLEDIGDLAAAAVVHLASDDASSAWNGVVLPAEVVPTSAPWLDAHLRASLVDSAHRRLAAELRLPTADGLVGLDRVAFEHEDLDRVLLDLDVRLLAPDRAPIPSKSRDDAGRWREALRIIGGAQELVPDDALSLLDMSPSDLGARPPGWFVTLMAALIRADLFEEAREQSSILRSDGERTAAPGAETPWILVERIGEGSLGDALGVAVLIHPGYLAGDEHARLVADTLRQAGVLVDNADHADVALPILARGAAATDVEPIRLSDDALVALRDAFERLGEDDQRRLGPLLGASIQLRGYEYDDSEVKVPGFVRPVDAYLPAAIDRETESFARAAATTPGLVWIDTSYARVLKRTGGRTEIGAQRFLVRLGAATQPRVTRPSGEWRRYEYEPPGRPIPSPRLTIQNRELRPLSPPRTYLLDDHDAPDLDAVIGDIVRDRPAAKRRRRSLALLTVLSRAWERHYAAYQTAHAVYDHYSWKGHHGVTATWLARASEAEWLPSATGRLRAPMDLLLPTEANRIAYTDRSAFLVPIEESVLRGPAVVGLRLRRGPSARDLIDRLRELSVQPLQPETGDEARAIYRQLASLVPREVRSAPVDDMTAQEVRAAFGGSGKYPGLIWSGQHWCGSKEVFSGPPIFGRLAAFAPDGAAYRPLWTLLGLREPSFEDCVSILRRLGEEPLAASDVGVHMETLRTMGAMLRGQGPQSRARLKRFPVWTGTQWERSRPVYAIAERALAEEVARRAPVWQAGFTTFFDIAELIDALGLTVLERGDFKVAKVTAADRVSGDHVRERFAAAVGHLQDELARGDPDLHRSLAVHWSDLGRADLYINPDLVLEAEVPNGPPVRIDAEAHFVPSPLALVVRSVEALADSSAGGAAIAALFGGDRLKVAWAWASMWQRAEAGGPSAVVVLSNDVRAEDSEEQSRLVKLRDQSAGRRAGRPSGGATKAQGRGPAMPIRVRQLKDLSKLEVSDGTIVNEGKTRGGVIAPPPTIVKRPDGSPGKSDGAPDAESTAAGTSTSAKRERTVLPPADDREQLAFDAVRWALALEPDQLQDLRARRGVGADAMDHLHQLFEIKMASGPRGDDVSLTRAEAEAARADPDFFLAVVAGLEDGDTPLSVRFIMDPLRRLSLRITGEITLSGVNEVEALEYVFR